jgi:hypothetical protein
MTGPGLAEAPMPTVGRAPVAATTDRLATWARTAARPRVVSRQRIWLAGTIARRVLAEAPMPTVGRPRVAVMIGRLGM